MFKSAQWVLVAAFVAATGAVCAGAVVAGDGPGYDLTDPAWQINETKTALKHVNTGMEFPLTMGTFQMEENIVHDNEGKSVTATYVSGEGNETIRASIFVRAGESRTIERCFRVGTLAFGLRNGNTKPYKTANIRIPTGHGSIRGKAAAYNVKTPDGSEQNDTRLYMFKLGSTLVRVQTIHPMEYVDGGRLIHNDLLKQMRWGSLNR